MDYIVHVGLGTLKELDSVVVVWPDNTNSVLINPSLNKLHIVNQQHHTGIFDYHRLHEKENKLLTARKENIGISYRHMENSYVDFDRDRLIYHMMSTLGPAASVADFNGDKLDDIFLGGSKGLPGEMFFQTPAGTFKKSDNKVFQEDKGCEDVRSMAFDANGDGFTDLYVVSGGNEFAAESSDLKDRLYLNNGKGNFTKDKNFNSDYSSNLAISTADYDGDGDMDLFIGERIKMFNYGVHCSGKILRNDDGKYNDITIEMAPDLQNLGMITDAVWVDINQDNAIDLVVVGEYMPVSIFINQGGKLVNYTKEYGLDKSQGWYNRIKVDDVNNDNKPDLILANHGLNSRFKADVNHPVSMYVNDFDRNGSVEQIICIYEGDKSYPVVLKHDLVKQLPYLKKKYLKYSAYQDQTIFDLFTDEERKNMIALNAYDMESYVLINTGQSFERIALPAEAQFAPIYDMEILDVNKDGKKDLIVGGNLYGVKPETGRYDASIGLVLLGNGKGNFHALNDEKSGFDCQGEIRQILLINIAKKQKLMIVRNNDDVMIFDNNIQSNDKTIQ